MTTWNYRVVRTTYPEHENEEAYEIASVYYDNDGNPSAWHGPESPGGMSLDELADDLHRMSAALSRPVIDRPDLPGGRAR